VPAQRGIVYYTYQEKTEFVFPEELRDMEGMDKLAEQLSALGASSSQYALHFEGSASLMRPDSTYIDGDPAEFDPVAFADKLEDDLGESGLAAFGMWAYANGGAGGLLGALTPPSVEGPPLGYYVDFVADTYLLEHSLLGRKFLVSDTRRIPSWKVSQEERAHLGRRIVKATATIDTLSVVAWFTPEIPVLAGPALYNGLPGLILVVEVQGEKGRFRLTYTAESIDLNSSAAQVTRPNEGPLVSPEEFGVIVEHKNQELRDNKMRFQRGLGF